VNDDAKWFFLAPQLLPALQIPDDHDDGCRRVSSISRRGMNLTPIFDEYLRHAEIPTLELKFQRSGWPQSHTAGRQRNLRFAMPVRVGKKGRLGKSSIPRTAEWKTLPVVDKERRFLRVADRSLLRQCREVIGSESMAGMKPASARGRSAMRILGARLDCIAPALPLGKMYIPGKRRRPRRRQRHCSRRTLGAGVRAQGVRRIRCGWRVGKRLSYARTFPKRGRCTRHCPL